MPIAVSALGDIAVINRLGGTNMKTAETFHATMLPNRKPVGMLDIIPRAYTLAQAARSAFFPIVEEILVNICQMFLPFIVMLFAGRCKKLPCCMSFSMLDGA